MTSTSTPAVSTFSKPVVSGPINKIAQSLTSATLKSDALMSEFLHTLSVHPHVGRKDSRGVSVTLVKGSDPKVVTIGTMRAAYDALGLDKSTGSRILRAASLATITGYVGSDAAKSVTAAVLGSAAFASVMFSDGANATLVEGADLTTVATAVGAYSAKVDASAKAKAEAAAKAEADASAAAAAETKAEVGAESVTLPNGIPARLDMIEAIVAGLGSEVTPATFKRIAAIVESLGAITSTAPAKRAKRSA